MSERADLILLGDVYTVDAARSWAKAVAIRGDRIVAVGSEADVRERVGTAEVISGACIVPGFQDAHIHAAFAGRIRRHVNLDDLHDVDDYLARIAEHVAAHPDEPWVVGGGWYAPVFGGGRAASAAAGRDRARSPRLPDEHRHACGVGEHAGRSSSPGSPPRRPTRGTATTCATPTACRPAACRREPPTRSGPITCPPTRSRTGWSRSASPSGTCTGSASPPGRTPGCVPIC